MEWFSGSIPAAISTSKIQKAVFVVFVSDSSEASTTSESSLAGAASELKKHTVAIKLDNTSDECKQFSQIYPVVVVPSIYFINPVTGIPVEILAGPVTADVLADKLPAILAAGKTSNGTDGDSTATTSAPPAQPPQTQAAAAATGVSEPAAGAASGAASAPAVARGSDAEKQGDSAEDREADSRLPSQSDTAAGGGEGSVSLEERVARAKALAEQKRLEREEELKQKSISEETQRRQMGKEMRRMKREQEEKEMKEIAAERRKDKEMDRLARERVKAQIAADRAERETRAALLRGEAAPPSPPTAAPAAAAATGPAPSVCRLKLRLPDGSSMLAQFPPSAPLSAVRQHLLDQGSLPFTQFRLASSLHQRPYSDTDMDTSLADLGLAPSAIIIVMPTGRSAGAVVASSGGLMDTLLWLLLLPYNTVLGLIRSVFGGGAPAPASSGGTAGQPPSAPRAGGSGDAVRRRTDRPKTAYGTRTEARLRREGNIHRLGNEDDSDENNTWNGNSTQQM